MPYPNDPEGSVCPYCGQTGRICSHIDSLARAWGRQACKYKHDSKNDTTTPRT